MPINIPHMFGCTSAGYWRLFAGNPLSFHSTGSCTVSFLSLSLNLNCNRSALSWWTRIEGHCGILGQISQVCTLHAQALLLDGQDLIFPSPHVGFLPVSGHCLPLTHAGGANAFWARVREGAGLDGSPIFPHRRSWGQGSILIHSFVHSFVQ